jgi:hypothetical protein
MGRIGIDVVTLGGRVVAPVDLNVALLRDSILALDALSRSLAGSSVVAPGLDSRRSSTEAA